jgi:TetR/AcrR family transcriptional regulator, lmrAB and yxaGH operons repressor
MGRRSDTRQKMITAARELLREHGFHAMSFTDVLARSGASRGSIYHHFPAGKEEIAAAAAGDHARAQLTGIAELGQAAATPAELIGGYLDWAREGMLASGYGRGCGVAPLVVEVGADSAELAAASRRAFQSMIDGLAFQFIVLGVELTAARELAQAVIAAVEGALVTARALHSPEPFDAIRAALLDRARSLPPAPAEY